MYLSQTSSTKRYNDAKLSLLKSGNSSVKLSRGKLWSTLHDVCELLKINVQSYSSIMNEDMLFQHVKFKSGQRVYTIGQPFEMVYLVTSGFLKTIINDELGNEQVFSFPMKSDLIGTDAIHMKHHVSEAVALTDCELIAIPFDKLTALGRRHPNVDLAIYKILSKELTSKQQMIGTLGALNSEGRVARFLVSTSDKFAQLGYSASTFNLRMSRQEIGSYLGLTLETVSRTLSMMSQAGLISVEQRTIQIHSIDALRTMRRLPPNKTRNKAKAAEAAKAAA